MVHPASARGIWEDSDAFVFLRRRHVLLSLGMGPHSTRGEEAMGEARTGARLVCVAGLCVSVSIVLVLVPSRVIQTDV